MPEHRDLPLFRWGEELRRHRTAVVARRRRGLAAASAAVALAGLSATLLWPPRPVLLWNGSASSPVGLYLVGPATSLAAGDMAVAWPPDQARQLGASRHYLPENVPLVKRVAAAEGDRVCAAGHAIFVNGRLAALRRASDPSERPMPWWSGCEVIEAGDLFLMSPDASEAFDGRYFGLTRRDQVVGSARLLWAR
jgi:conjugative transfer signal peptidase TraF